MHPTSCRISTMLGLRRCNPCWLPGSLTRFGEQAAFLFGEGLVAKRQLAGRLALSASTSRPAPLAERLPLSEKTKPSGVASYQAR